MAEKSTERVREWSKKNMDKRREQTRLAQERFRNAWMERDPEGYAEYNRRTSRESMKKRYHEKRAAMTPEELEAERAKRREQMKKYREKKKQQKEALEAEQKKQKTEE